jgi:uncharacterized protein DUF551
MSEWISINDRMPKKRQMVDLWANGVPADISFYCAPYTMKSTGRITSCRWDEAQQGWHTVGGLGAIIYSLEVTHWMPLPEPPNV